MRLGELLSLITTEELERLAHEHARADEDLSRPQLLETIESVLRSYRFLQEFLQNRQPPTFAMMLLLLDQPDAALPTVGFRDAVLAETEKICAAIDSEQILKRDDQLRVYRRVLYQARSNDRLIDASEAAILSVLRQELEIANVEHFLIEHHVDLREFWQQDGAFAGELLALRSAGLVFAHEGRTMIAADVAPAIRQVLGLDMPRDAARRLFGHLSGPELYDALANIGAPTSGSKDEKVERLITHHAQPRVALQRVGLETLREICRDTGAAVSGSKDELVRRVVGHFAAGRDLIGEPEPPPPVEEPRRLDRERFASLFSQFRGHELAGLLGEFELRRWGGKDLQIETLWESHRAETTLLSKLSNPELEGVLRRVELRPGGSKAERVERLLTHFAASPHTSSSSTTNDDG